MTAPRFGLRLAAVLALLGAVAPATRAQNWRTLTAHRALGRDDSLRVVVRYGLGALKLRAAESATLYDISIRYDADRFRPERRYDAPTHTLTVGADSATIELFSLRPRTLAGGSHNNAKGGEMTLALARGIPLDLTVKFGVGEAELDLGDLWISHLRVEAALGGATITFRTPNSRPMDQMSIEAALGGVTVNRLGNAHVRHVTLDAALGGGDVDFRGEWTGEMTLDVKSVLGGFNIRVPRDAGLIVHSSSTLGGMDSQGLIRRADGAYVSANYSSAARRITVNAKNVLGGIGLDWVEP